MDSVRDGGITHGSTSPGLLTEVKNQIIKNHFTKSKEQLK